MRDVTGRAGIRIEPVRHHADLRGRQFGQRLKAVVVRKKGAKLTDKEVKDYVKSNLANYKVPRDVEFLDELPRKPQGKVDKHQLEEGNDG